MTVLRGVWLASLITGCLSQPGGEASGNRLKAVRAVAGQAAAFLYFRDSTLSQPCSISRQSPGSTFCFVEGAVTVHPDDCSETPSSQPVLMAAPDAPPLLVASP